jgi:4-phospho-D-threonate 3-dehydrogenase / 4-phospho-D-erythronate 3-dehydrogenase
LQNSNPSAGPPLLAVAIGDPSGVGTEISVKALATGEPQRKSRVMLIGNLDGIQETAKTCGINLNFQRISAPSEARTTDSNAIPVYDDAAITTRDYKIGHPSAAGGHAASGWIDQAIAWAEATTIDGFIIAPIDNTSFKLAGLPKPLPTMHPPNTFLLRTSGKLRFIPLGEHVMIRDIPAMVTKANVLHLTTLIDNMLRRWGVQNPRIAVAGLNPHAAGIEDAEQIAPAVEEARVNGLDVTGPLSPDTVFRRALHGEFDVVVAMYHDQGQIAIKTTGLEEACAIFIGLPYVRVGTPHGSALDIAGQNKAQHNTMLTALNAAANLAAGAGL